MHPRDPAPTPAPNPLEARWSLEERDVVTVTSLAGGGGTGSVTTVNKTVIPIGAIVGGIVAGVAVVLIVGGMWWYCHAKKEKEREARRKRHNRPRAGTANSRKPISTRPSGASINTLGKPGATQLEEKVTPVPAIPASAYVLNQQGGGGGDMRNAGRGGWDDRGYPQQQQRQQTQQAYGQQQQQGQEGYQQYPQQYQQQYQQQPYQQQYQQQGVVALAPVIDTTVSTGHSSSPSRDRATSPTSPTSASAESTTPLNPASSTSPSSTSSSSRSSEKPSKSRMRHLREPNKSAANGYQPSKPSPLAAAGRAAQESKIKQDEDNFLRASSPLETLDYNQTGQAMVSPTRNEFGSDPTGRRGGGTRGGAREQSGEWGVAYAQTTGNNNAYQSEPTKPQPARIAYQYDGSHRSPPRQGHGDEIQMSPGYAAYAYDSALGQNYPPGGQGVEDPYTASAYRSEQGGNEDPYANQPSSAKSYGRI